MDEQIFVDHINSVSMEAMGATARAEAAFAKMQRERDYYEAKWREAEGERFEADAELDQCRAPRRVEGTLPADDLRRAFVDGAAWWNFKTTAWSMRTSERREAEAEAAARYPNGRHSGGGGPPAPTDWAHYAARGILADLTDRRGVKHGFDDIDEDVRVEMVAAMAEIIRSASREMQQ